MQFKRCPSLACGRPFQVNRFSPRLSHSFELGKITCPHCGLQFDGDSKAVFLTHALSAHEEAEFNAREASEQAGRTHPAASGEGDFSRHPAE